MNLIAIKHEIKKKGLKNYWLAEQIGVHPTTLSRFLNGRTVLRSEALMELLDVLNIDAKSLVKDAA